MKNGHEIQLQTRGVTDNPVQFGDRIIGTQDDSVEIAGYGLEFAKVLWRGAEHEIEVERCDRRSEQGCSRVSYKHTIEVFVCERAQGGGELRGRIHRR